MKSQRTWFACTVAASSKQAQEPTRDLVDKTDLETPICLAMRHDVSGRHP